MPENVPLTHTEQPAPPVGIDQPVTLAGNYADDDPIALDQYFESADQGPERFDGLRIPHNEIPTASRLITRRYNFLLTTPQSVQALPPDTNRRHLYLLVWAQAAQQSACYSGEPFAAGIVAGTIAGSVVFVPVAAGKIVTAITLDDYTGPLYIGNAADNEINFEITAVTI